MGGVHALPQDPPGDHQILSAWLDYRMTHAGWAGAGPVSLRSGIQERPGHLTTSSMHLFLMSSIFQKTFSLTYLSHPGSMEGCERVESHLLGQVLLQYLIASILLNPAHRPGNTQGTLTNVESGVWKSQITCLHSQNQKKTELGLEPGEKPKESPDELP